MPDTTEALGGPLAEFLADRIPKVASRVHRRYKDIPAQDYEQAMWLEMLAHPAKYRKYLEEDRGGLVQRELYRACKKVTEEDRRYRLAVQAASDGFSVYDIQFYSPTMLAHLLPALVEAGFDVSVAMVDVVKAYDRLPEGMKRLLKTYYAVNQEDTEEGRWDRESLASSMGLTRHALEERVRRARQRLADELGGSDPWQ
jgi:alpha-ketoglutarate-dependent taurine dioxygenase